MHFRLFFAPYALPSALGGAYALFQLVTKFVVRYATSAGHMATGSIMKIFVRLSALYAAVAASLISVSCKEEPVKPAPAPTVAPVPVAVKIGEISGEAVVCGVNGFPTWKGAALESTIVAKDGGAISTSDVHFSYVHISGATIEVDGFGVRFAKKTLVGRPLDYAFASEMPFEKRCSDSPPRSVCVVGDILARVLTDDSSIAVQLNDLSCGTFSGMTTPKFEGGSPAFIGWRVEFAKEPLSEKIHDTTSYVLSYGCLESPIDCDQIGKAQALPEGFKYLPLVDAIQVERSLCGLSKPKVGLGTATSTKVVGAKEANETVYMLSINGQYITVGIPKSSPKTHDKKAEHPELLEHPTSAAPAASSSGTKG